MPAFKSPLIHAHAVGKLGSRGGVHRVPILDARTVGEPGSGDRAARRFGRMIEWRQELPLGFAGIDDIVGHGPASGGFPGEFGEADTGLERLPDEFIDAGYGFEEVKIRAAH